MDATLIPQLLELARGLPPAPAAVGPLLAGLEQLCTLTDLPSSTWGTGWAVLPPRGCLGGGGGGRGMAGQPSRSTLGVCEHVYRCSDRTSACCLLWQPCVDPVLPRVGTAGGVELAVLCLRSWRSEPRVVLSASTLIRQLSRSDTNKTLFSTGTSPMG